MTQTTPTSRLAHPARPTGAEERASPTPLLVADCVGKAFRGRPVLTAATLRAVPGELRVLFGRNGVGKSTLLRIAAGLIEADTGSVRMDGVPVERPRLAWLAHRGVFFLPDRDLLSAALTVRAQLRWYAAAFGSSPTDGRAEGAQGALDEPVEESAERAGIAHVLDARAGALSGGERRRADLAVVLVRRPRCLLADEPLRGVAPRDAEALLALFRELARSCAVVLTGHDVPDLFAVADHITFSTSGTTYELGSPARAREDERFRREYLGPPRP